MERRFHYCVYRNDWSLSWAKRIHSTPFTPILHLKTLLKTSQNDTRVLFWKCTCNYGYSRVTKYFLKLHRKYIQVEADQLFYILSEQCHVFLSLEAGSQWRNFLPFMVHYLFTRPPPCTLSTLLSAFHINCPGSPSVSMSPSALFAWVSAAILCAFHMLHSLLILSSLIWSFLVLYVDE